MATHNTCVIHYRWGTTPAFEKKIAALTINKVHSMNSKVSRKHKLKPMTVPWRFLRIAMFTGTQILLDRYSYDGQVHRFISFDMVC